MVIRYLKLTLYSADSEFSFCWILGLVYRYFAVLYVQVGDRGGTVVKVLCYKSEGCWFEPNIRLHRIRISPTDNCSECNNIDTLHHRLTERGENRMHWEWLQQIIARMLRTYPMNIPRDWLATTSAVLSLASITATIGFVAAITLRNLRPFSTRKAGSSEFDGLLARSRWKTHQMPGRRKLLANFLTVLDTFQNWIRTVKRENTMSLHTLP
jgi:hypothetical protein